MLTSSPRAQSQDGIYSAYGCTATHNSTDDIIFTTLAGGYVYNVDSGIHHNVACALVRRYSADDPSVTVWVDDGDSSDNLTCTLIASSTYSDPVTDVTDSATTSGTGDKVINMSITNHGLGSNAKYSLYCSLPDSGSSGTFKVYGYKLNE